MKSRMTRSISMGLASALVVGALMIMNPLPPEVLGQPGPPPSSPAGVTGASAAAGVGSAPVGQPGQAVTAAGAGAALGVGISPAAQPAAVAGSAAPAGSAGAQVVVQQPGSLPRTGTVVAGSPAGRSSFIVYISLGALITFGGLALRRRTRDSA